MICKKCGAEFDGAFCPKCGERAEEKMTVCPVCGKERAEGENFCAKCGYAFEGQATATQKPQAKITFDKEALIGGVRKFYKVALNIGKVVFSVLLLLILASPIMLHEGINTAGSGYTNAFNLYVDGRFTAVCAILMIIAFYSLIYAVFRCVRYFVFHNGKEGKTDRIAYFALNLAVFVLCCVGCSGAGDWFADAGAGLSFGIFVGIVGMALSVLRYLFEDKFVDADGSQTVEVSDDVKAVEKKATKKVKLGTAIVTGALVVAVIITSIVQGVYTNPFSSASYGFAETRADVIKQFGMPENAKEDSSSYTYYSTEYAAAERMIDALIEAQEKDLSDDFDMDADSFDEDDLESMFDGAMGIDGIIEKLEEKQDNIKYKKSVVTFNNDGGDDRNNDTVKSYVCEVVTPAVEGEDKTERKLKKFTYEGTIENWTNIVNIIYFAKYDDGSFIRSSAELDVTGDNNKFNDMFGEYSIDITDLQKISPTLIDGIFCVKDDTMYIVRDINHVIEYEGSKSINKIFIEEGVTSIANQAFKNFTSVNEISGGNDLTYIGKDAFSATEYYNDDANWKDGVLYIMEDSCVIGIKDNVEELTVQRVLAEGAATGNTSLKKVVFGEYVKNIEDSAFEGCHSLTSVTFGENSELKSIGDYAFYNCSSLASITIPDSVTSIGSYAFYECSSLESVTFGENSKLESIGFYAFRGCGSLTSITMPDSVTSIGNDAFYNCSSLASITIPDSVTSIGSYAFYECSSLESVTFGENSKLESIGFYAFRGCSSLTSITIPSSVTSIGDDAFYYCSSLTSITIPANVTSIGSYAFSDCSSLTSVTFGENSKLESIGFYAFSRCSSLTSITIPSSVTSIGECAFYYCSSLTEIIYNAVNVEDLTSSSNVFYNAGTNANGITVEFGESVERIPAYLFYVGDSSYRSKITSVTIGSNVTSIGEYAFYRCSSFTSITIPANVTSIGSAAFRGCSSLTSITIPANVTSIGNSAFSGCSSLTSITIPDSVTSIGDWAFYNCSSLTSVTFGENSKLESIGSAAFSGCSSLTSITIPSSVTSIGAEAFYGCSLLTSITIPSSVTSIGNSAFSGCSSLTSITIPSSVTSIGNFAFSGCSSLTSITIPDSVTSIGNSAFSGCSSLTSVNFGENSQLESIGSSAFYKCSSLTSVNFGENSQIESIGSSAFYNCSSLTSITIPDSVTSIGSYAFGECSSLTEIIYNAVNVEDLKNSSYVFYNAGTNANGITVVFRESVERIPAYLFYVQTWSNWPKITSVTIGSNVTSIGEYAFYYCSSLESVTFGENSELESIGSSAFYGCSSLTSITIPSSVTSIDYRAFYGCSSLTSVIFKNTQGWWYSDSSSATSGTNISSSDLSDPATAASYLRFTYCNYYWKRG